MFSYIIPTRNRTDELLITLRQIGRLHSAADAPLAQVVIADNASEDPVTHAVAEEALGEAGDRVCVRVIHLDENYGAAARNTAAEAADSRCRWLVMLDDDSAPTSLDFAAVINSVSDDVAAVAAEIFLPSPAGTVRRETGGLPEVFVGCGVALRRSVFTKLGGYDEDFGYYVEEYDLAAKIIAAGYRTVLDRRFTVMHRKVAGNRDMNMILERLVRNNILFALRHAPAGELMGAIAEPLGRYARIAVKEKSLRGYVRGVWLAVRAATRQKRTPLNPAGWARLTGMAAARLAVLRLVADGQRTVKLIAEGKNGRIVREALAQQNLSEAGPDASREVACLVATLSPGPMWDAADAERAARAGDATSGRVYVPFEPLEEPAAAAAPKLTIWGESKWNKPLVEAETPVRATDAVKPPAEPLTMRRSA